MKTIAILTRGAVLASTAGNERYVISIFEELRRAGFRGVQIAYGRGTLRWGIGRIRPEASAVFESVEVEGTIRMGTWLIRRDAPKAFIRTVVLTAVRAMPAGVARLIAVAIPPIRRLLERARRSQWNIAEPTPAERAFIARSLDKLVPDGLLLNYFYSAAVLDLAPGVPSMVVTHDIFWRRVASFAGAGAAADIDLSHIAREREMLRAAGAVAAIQSGDAALLAEVVGPERVVLAPMAADVREETPAGDVPGRCLFVGSSATPNVISLRWFLADVWPAIRAGVPEATLDVVGSVGATVQNAPPGVRLHGVQSDLSEWYARAQVCLVPLRLGSGLKIKLIEALGHGRAVVSTSTGVEGVEALVADVVAVSDDPNGFAAAVIRLLRDDSLRQDVARRSLKLAKAHFRAEATYRGIVEYFAKPR